jgi:hypothetical protein
MRSDTKKVKTDMVFTDDSPRGAGIIDSPVIYGDRVETAKPYYL